MSRPTALVIAALAAGVAFAWSPLSAIAMLVLLAILRSAVVGLAGAERRWVLGALVAAIVMRVTAIIAIFLATDPARQPYNALFPDGVAIIARSWWVRNAWLGVPIGPFYTGALYDPYGASSHYYLLAFLQTLLGPAPYALTLVSVAAYLAGCVCLFRTARSAYGREAAMFGLLVVLFLPTLAAWSISVLKDPIHFCLAAITVCATYWCCRSVNWRARSAWGVLAASGLYALTGLRTGAFEIAAAGLAAGLLLRLVTWRLSIAALAVAVSLVIAAAVASRADIRQRAWDQLQLAANRHLGHVQTEGLSYRVLDERFYVEEGFESVFTMTTGEGVRFVLRSLASVVLVPLPWRSTSTTSFALIPQQVAWYILVLLAIAGLAAGFSRDATFTCLLVGYAFSAAAVIALNSGNVGTFVRYRDMLVPFVVWISAAGAWHLAAFAVRAPAARSAAAVT